MECHTTVENILCAISHHDDKIPLELIHLIIYFTGDRLTVPQLDLVMSSSDRNGCQEIKIHSFNKVEKYIITPRTAFWCESQDILEGFEGIYAYTPHLSTLEKVYWWDSRHRFELILFPEYVICCSCICSKSICYKKETSDHIQTLSAD